MLTKFDVSITNASKGMALMLILWHHLFYEKPEVQAVLTSSDTKLFLAQDKSEIQYIKEVFKLSDGEAYFLTTCSRGEGLLKVGEDTAIIAIKPTKKEFEFVETNLNKLKKEE